MSTRVSYIKYTINVLINAKQHEAAFIFMFIKCKVNIIESSRLKLLTISLVSVMAKTQVTNI